jgi:opacity protein-like surface antigen
MRRIIGDIPNSRSGRAGPRRRAGAIAALVLAASPWAARAAEPAAPAPSLGSRFYGGVGLASVHYDDTYGDVAFSGSSLGLGLYGGFRVNDHLSVELAYDGSNAIDLHDVAGSGIVHFDVDSQLRTLSASVLRQFSLREFLNLQRDWRVFGMLGVYDSKIDRTVTDLASNAQVSAEQNSSGVLAGAGVLYRLGRVDLRGGLRFWGDARDVDVAAQFRF